MAQPFKGINSKVFLLIYLVGIAVILLLWVSRMEIQQPDRREIPAALSPFLFSPVKSLPQLLMNEESNQHVFTNASLEGKWSFVYFTQGFCSPGCERPLSVMSELNKHFAEQSIQFVLINYDLNPSSSAVLKQLSQSQRFSSFKVLEAKPDILEKVIKAFGFLFLKTQVDDGYVFEQEHIIYLIDPKVRIYAAFESPFSVDSIVSTFFEIRHFYARTE